MAEGGRALGVDVQRVVVGEGELARGGGAGEGAGAGGPAGGGCEGGELERVPLSWRSVARARHGCGKGVGLARWWGRGHVREREEMCGREEGGAWTVGVKGEAEGQNRGSRQRSGNTSDRQTKHGA